MVSPLTERRRNVVPANLHVDEHARHSLLSTPPSLAMSDKVKEFIEIPQEFVKDGQQVSLSSTSRSDPCSPATVQFLTRCTKPSYKGEYTTCSECPSSMLIKETNRIYSDLQGCSCWLRRHGFHRLLREAHPHSDVSPLALANLHGLMICFPNQKQHLSVCRLMRAL